MIPFNKTEAVVAPVTEDDRWLGRYIDFIVKCTFAIAEDGAVTALPADAQAPIKGDEVHGDDLGRSVKYPSDVDPPKTLTDIVFHGSAHAPGGDPVEQLEVGLGVGKWSKRLVVTGDREWRQNDLGDWRLSQPTPFTEMPMRWERAYGGLYDQRNPTGRGAPPPEPLATLSPTGEIVTPAPDPDPVVMAPNIEYPNQLVRDFSDRPVPAGFGPIPPYWEARNRLAGTRDHVWANTVAPQPPKDFDPRFYNAAPEDQQITGVTGNESVALQHLSARGETVSFNLPGLRPRVFYVEAEEETRTLNEVPMQLDTVFIDGEEHQVTLVWRARLEHAYDDPSEQIDYLVAVWDRVGVEERPVAEIQKEFLEEIPPFDEALGVRKLTNEQMGMQMMVPAVAEMVKALKEARAAPEMIEKVRNTADPRKLFDFMVGEAKTQASKLETMSRETTARYGTIDDEIAKGAERPPDY